MMEEQQARAQRTIPGVESITTAEAAWAAGLIEGEGNFSSYAIGTGKNLRHNLYLRVSMTDLDVLQRLQGILGGRLNGPYWGHKATKPMWTWQTGKRDVVDRAVSHIYPWLGSRRQFQCREAYLRAGRSLPFEGGE